MKKLFSISLLACISIVCLAGKPPTRHSVRIGWGDMLFETLAFHPSARDTFNPEALPDDFRSKGNFGHAYTGHIFADYMYSFTDVVSAGVQTDFEGIFWKEGQRDASGAVVGDPTQVNNFNLCILPAVRFTYFRSEWVDIYSGLSLGLLMAFDNRNQFELAPTFNLNLVGVRVGRGHWNGTAEIGLLNALKSANDVYMFGSRLFSVGVNYIW
ncbi:MAG: hypothetical protein IJU21_06400 [Bacteroidales bacterium]|nr:hypothetical protein [Bacteroidales bacterium]